MVRKMVRQERSRPDSGHHHFHHHPATLILGNSLCRFPILSYFCIFENTLGEVCPYVNTSRLNLKTSKDMSLFDTISNDIQQAMKARDKVRLEALRGVKKEFLEARSAPGAGGELSDADALKIITKLVKQRRESARIYEENNRPELAGNELAEAAVIEEYLPKQLTAEEIEKEVREIVAQTGATGPKDMGKVMKAASPRFAGRADGRAVSDTVKQVLNSL